VAGMSTALGRRLKKLEGGLHAERSARWTTAMDGLLGSMEPEHVSRLQAWMREHVGGLRIPLRPGETVYALCSRYVPPALIRAAWLLMFEHMDSGAPVSLARAVAEVYLGDPDAFPVNPCEACGYLFPARASIRPDGTYRLLPGWYMGICPVCGLDNHSEGEAPDDDSTESSPAPA